MATTEHGDNMTSNSQAEDPTPVIDLTRRDEPADPGAPSREAAEVVREDSVTVPEFEETTALPVGHEPDRVERPWIAQGDFIAVDADPDDPFQVRLVVEVLDQREPGAVFMNLTPLDLRELYHRIGDSIEVQRYVEFGDETNAGGAVEDTEQEDASRRRRNPTDPLGISRWASELSKKTAPGGQSWTVLIFFGFIFLVAFILLLSKIF